MLPRGGRPPRPRSHASTRLTSPQGGRRSRSQQSRPRRARRRPPAAKHSTPVRTTGGHQARGSASSTYLPTAVSGSSRTPLTVKAERPSPNRTARRVPKCAHRGPGLRGRARRPLESMETARCPFRGSRVDPVTKPAHLLLGPSAVAGPGSVGDPRVVLLRVSPHVLVRGQVERPGHGLDVDVPAQRPDAAFERDLWIYRFLPVWASPDRVCLRASSKRPSTRS